MKHPKLPLVHSYEMRNFVTHGYQHVDYEIVWKTIRDDLPALGHQVSACIRELSGAGSDSTI